MENYDSIYRFRPPSGVTTRLGDTSYAWSELYMKDSSSTVQKLDTVETWTFTLSDNTTVTKKILVG